MNEADLAQIRDWAERFWLLAGKSEPFPRTLESAVSWALPIILVKLPRLDVESIRQFAKTNGLRLECHVSSRPIRGCLMANAGSGIVFLEGADPPDEMRFTLAHEVAHFLLDHIKPRQEAVHALGSDVQEILNGEREPTPKERLNAIFQGVSFERFVHFMDRNQECLIAKSDVMCSEDRADLLALELLAPIQCIQESLVSKHVAWTDQNSLRVVQALLVNEFGLPIDIAQNYARFLSVRRTPSPTFRDWLRRKK